MLFLPWSPFFSYTLEVNVFDLIILAILAALTLRGIWKGMISQLVSVAAIFVCWIVATRFGSLVAPTIPVEAPWDQVLAMGIVFLITWIAIRFAHAALEKIIKHWHLEKLNKLLGGALGFAKGLLICLILTFFAVMVSETSRDVVFNSKSGFHMVKLIAQIGLFVPKNSYEFVHKQLALFQDKIDEAVPGQTPETVQVQSSETMQQLLEQVQQTTETTKTGAGSLLTALSQWWNGTEEEPVEESMEKFIDPLLNSLVQTVTAPAAHREESRPAAATYTPPPSSPPSPSSSPPPPSMFPQMSHYAAVPQSVVPPLSAPPPHVAVEEFFIQRSAANPSPAIPPSASSSSVPMVSSQPSLSALTSLVPLSESVLMSPEPAELLPITPRPQHVGSDLLLRNSTLPESADAPARVFRPH